jgi:hypothetical protein
MKIKPVFRIISTLIVLILVANPLLATAGNLFSSFMQAHQSSMINTDESDSVMPCHQDNQTSSVEVIKEQPKKDCCKDVCLCDDSSCHGFSLLFQTTTSVFYLSGLKTQFHIPLYLSLSTTPKSPPPII